MKSSVISQANVNLGVANVAQIEYCGIRTPLVIQLLTTLLGIKQLLRVCP
jgi:hypothetical protein